MRFRRKLQLEGAVASSADRYLIHRFNGTHKANASSSSSFLFASVKKPSFKYVRIDERENGHLAKLRDIQCIKV